MSLSDVLESRLYSSDEYININNWTTEKLFCSCQNKSTIPVPCSAGEYSPGGTISCSDCPKGFYCPKNKLSSPIFCPNGTYSDSTGAVECVECPPGKSCVYGHQSPLECDNGTYSTGGSVRCTLCPAGYRY
jgi:hypothetical protein